MAKFFKNFLSNVGQGVTNPKGNLGDFAHASRLFVQSNYRLAPKQKFLYHCVFNINPAVKGKFQTLSTGGSAINMLVKTVDLPKFKVSTDLAYQYNRKKQVHTKIEYDPVTVTFHDDNLGLTTGLWSSYYGYYFADSSHGPSQGSLPSMGSSGFGGTKLGGIISTASSVMNFVKSLGKGTNAANILGSSAAGVPAAYTNNTYKGEELNKFRYGLDNGSSVPFFSSIQIFQMNRRSFQSFTLINPKIVSMSHDNLSYAEGNGIAQNTMSIIYEAVIYGQGAVKKGNPTGFATEYYDQTPSPLSILGGGKASLFGQGGVLGGISDILGDLSDPGVRNNPFALFGTLVKGVNVVNNAKKLTKEGVRQEGYGLIKGAITAATGVNVSGVANTSFPKSGGNGQTQTTNALAPRETSRSSEPSNQDKSLIKNTSGALDSLTNLAISKGAVAPGPNARSQTEALLDSGRNPLINGLADKVAQQVKSTA
jgi:hypothetical protein